MRITERLRTANLGAMNRKHLDWCTERRETFFALDPVVFDVSNVAAYLFSGTAQEKWFIATDFPCLAPPFPAFAMEYETPRIRRSEVHGVQAHPVEKVTCLFVAVERPESHALARRYAEIKVVDPTNYSGEMMRKLREGVEQTRWAIHASVWVDFGDCFIGPVGIQTLFVGEAGEVISELPVTLGSIAPEVKEDDMQDAMRSPLFSPLLALSFLGCKSTTTREIEVEAPGLRKKRAAKGHAPPLRTYTLDIEPTKTVLRSEGSSESSGIRNALHVCRGHFGDYRERGLFGKHKGLFWFGPHLRGTAAEGIVAKDYRVASALEGV